MMTNTQRPVAQLQDRNDHTIQKGSVVHHGEGWLRVTAVYKGSRTLNLGPIFGSRTTLKRVPLDQVYEDNDAWYAWWSQTETYRCM